MTFNWTQPFTKTVWIFLILTLIITGLVAPLLEDESYRRILRDAPIPGSTISLIISFIQKSFSAFTGEYDLFSRTHVLELRFIYSTLDN